MSDPVHLGRWLLAQGFVQREDLVLHTGADLFARTFERDEGEDAISLVAQVIATPGSLGISLSPYFVPSQWSQIRARLAALIAALFEHRGVAAPPLEGLAQAWSQVQETQLRHAGVTLALEVAEAEPDQVGQEGGEHDFVTLTVRLGRRLAQGEWEHWCSDGPLHDLQARAISAERDLIDQCRRLLRAHRHPLADEELRVLFTQDATCVLTSPRGLSLHLSPDEPSLSIVHADGHMETLS